MQRHKFNVIMDLQWGSCGKGKFSPWLCWRHDVYNASGSNRPNAGHTVVNDVLEEAQSKKEKLATRYVFKVLPSPAILREWFAKPMMLFLSPAAAFREEQLMKELAICSKLCIHELAQLVTDADVEAEKTLQISSTTQGAGASLIRKIRREEHLALAGDVFDEYVRDGAHFRREVHNAVESHGMLHECSQGWGLSLDHGYKYPYVTSRNCGTAAALDQMGVSPRLLGDVYGIFRPYPIRVGNLPGQTSGPMPHDSRELTWEEIRAMSGATYDLTEKTTVTQRVRRVFTLSMSSLVDAVRANGVNRLILNFAQHIDTNDYKAREKYRLSRSTREFIRGVEEATNVDVVLVGTGPDHYDVVEMW